MLGRSDMTWCVIRKLKHLLCTNTSYHKVLKLLKNQKTWYSTHGKTNDVQPRTSHEIRQIFLDYFKQRDHQYIHSSSVLPKKGEGTYFVNAGMNQFKPLFLGTVDPGSQMASLRKAVNSQKCIRVGGKHNDLDDVGKDTYHHTFFEMLGSWSFGDYFKRDACSMAWDLMTRVYGLPINKLYVTYFAGNQQLGLEPDLECRDIWLQLGVSPNRILPGGMADNFWDMGETGPCGPCTEIHYDHVGRSCAADLVNTGNPEVVELWNLVFMQFDRQFDGTLRKLPRHHVDTGMGLERLTAVLQGTLSNYDTDLFYPLFQAIHKDSRCRAYEGRVGVDDVDGIDRAYRIIADHVRMSTVAIADGLLPGRAKEGSKLRHIIYRAARQANAVLNTPPGVLASLVPLVVQSLGDSFPELTSTPEKIAEVVDHTEARYLETMAVGRKMLEKALRIYRPTKMLSGEQVYELQDGRFGRQVPVDILQDLLEEKGLEMNLDEFEHFFLQIKDRTTQSVLQNVENRLCLDQYDLEHLKHLGIPATDVSSVFNALNNETLEAKVVGLKLKDGFVNEIGQDVECGILLDRSCFYAEAGGQVSDQGSVVTADGCEVKIENVQSSQHYVLHIGHVQRGSIRTGDSVRFNLNQDKRVGCMSNHTATHIIGFALDQVLGKCHQEGSMVSDQKLTFDFSCLKSTISEVDILEICRSAQNIVKQGLPVYHKEVPLQTAQEIKTLVMIRDEIYPEIARVVSVGVPIEDLLPSHAVQEIPCNSVALCGGTHVANTADIGNIVITNFQGTGQGPKRITAITGDLAQQALDNSEQLRQQLRQLSLWIKNNQNKSKWADFANNIEKSLMDGRPLPKVERDQMKTEIELLMRNAVSEEKNKAKHLMLQEEIKFLLENQESCDVVIENFKFTLARDVVAALGTLLPDKPVMLLTTQKKKHAALGVCYVPEAQRNKLDAIKWAHHVCTFMKGTASLPKGKHARYSGIAVLNFTVKSSKDMEQAIDLARTFANLYVTQNIYYTRTC